ncbi:MAG: aldehyde ferredoxin oxidoreductase family protein [Anaerolineaceae bacterium]
MSYGYHNKILHVDLTTGSIRIEEPGNEFYRTYMGGQAMGLYYLLKYLPPKIDALSKENILTITLSPITGIPISGQSRVVMSAKSPLTNAIGTSEAGGFWPAEAKRTGFDGFIIYGKAKKPVFLWIHDGQVEIRSASHLCGKPTGETEDLIRNELEDSKIQVLQTGIAGENLVRYASAINMCSRANGRTGMGAVMGSKNLKAIAVRGKQKIDVFDQPKLKELSRWGADNFKNSGAYGTGISGTAGLVSIQQMVGGLATKNWSSGVFDGAESISGEKMSETILIARETCFGCIVRCKRVVEVKDKNYQVDPRYGGPEFETIGAFGSLCGVSNLNAIAKAHELCCKYGMDTITTGSIIAWVMDLFEKGILTQEQTDGIQLRFGNADAMIELIHKIAKRDALGDLLAEGMDSAARKLGTQATKNALSVKGNPLPLHLPQNKRSMALIYAVNPYGADHQSSEHDVFYMEQSERMTALNLTKPQTLTSLNEEKVRFTMVTQRLASFLNTACLCQFVWGAAWQLYDTQQMVEMINAVTGWDLDLKECLLIGERSINMMRSFNKREGFTRADDKLPEKLFLPLKGGPTDGVKLDHNEIDSAISTYYLLSGWDENGSPTPQKLAELQLSWINEDFK